jgi:hypothetical protein
VLPNGAGKVHELIISESVGFDMSVSHYPLHPDAPTFIVEIN